MKKLFIIVSILFICAHLFPQKAFIQQSLVINIEVPVRVFDGKAFVDDLKMKDFEIYEDGVRQKVEAVYLVKKKSIERREEKKRFVPKTSRDFFLFFEVSEYSAKLNEALEYFVYNVISPGDNLYFTSPMKTYRLNELALGVRSKNEILSELKNYLRKDVVIGTSEYNRIVKDLTDVARSISSVIEGRSDSSLQSTGLSSMVEEGAGFGEDAIEELMLLYSANLSRLENQRNVDQLQLLDFAKYLKNKDGQKYVFLFYEREYIPRISPTLLDQYLSANQEKYLIHSNTSDLNGFFYRDISFNVDLIKQTYADASVAIHFLFVTSPTKHVYGVQMQEASNDIYGAFNEMAKATGGYVESSANPSYLFKNSLEASENYYLLYYSPKNYEPDGNFKEIEIRVKNKHYRVTNRQGYFAN